MTNLANISPPKLDGLTLTLSDETTLSIAGTIATRDPNPTIGAYFRKLHDALVAKKPERFVVNLTELTFVNSSAIRLFIDWAMWIGQSGKIPPYRLHFRTARGITWQQTNFSALQSLAPGVIEVEAR
jgi:hypothetical protein